MEIQWAWYQCQSQRKSILTNIGACKNFAVYRPRKDILFKRKIDKSIPWLRQKMINSIPCLRQKSQKTYPGWPHVPTKPLWGSTPPPPGLKPPLQKITFLIPHSVTGPLICIQPPFCRPLSNYQHCYPFFIVYLAHFTYFFSPLWNSHLVWFLYEVLKWCRTKCSHFL